MFTKTKRTRIATALAVAFVLLAIAMPAQATTQPITVQTVILNGAIAQVTVKNTSIYPASTVVSVQALVNGIAVWSSVPVALLGGQCLTVSAAFTAPPSKVMSVGVLDEGTPF